MSKEIYEEINNLIKAQKNFVVVTVIDIKGSAPQELGAKCIVGEEGLIFGTVGGGKIEAHVIKEAIKKLDSDKSIHVNSWNLQRDIGMTCGGEMSFSFEVQKSSPLKIAIFGAGHVAQALTRLLSFINCSVVCFDSRDEWLNKLDQKQNNLKRILLTEVSDLKELETLDESYFFISMTKGHSYDVPILTKVSELYPQCPYVGVIGSNTKGIRIKNELKSQGVPDHFIEKLRVPIGLPLGNNDPYEIGISVVSEILQVRDSINP